jgi:hypothetical protein
MFVEFPNPGSQREWVDFYSEAYRKGMAREIEKERARIPETPGTYRIRDGSDDGLPFKVVERDGETRLEFDPFLVGYLLFSPTAQWLGPL